MSEMYSSAEMERYAKAWERRGELEASVRVVERSDASQLQLDRAHLIDSSRWGDPVAMARTQQELLKEAASARVNGVVFEMRLQQAPKQA